MCTKTALSVIIVSWNVKERLHACIQSVLQTAKGFSYEIIVVDNSSPDGTREFLEKQAFPNTRIIGLTQNLGFPRANNVALREAKGDYILLLNPDTIVHEGTLERCIGELSSDPHLGAVGCRILYPDGSVQYEGGRNLPDLLDLLIFTPYLHMLFPRNKLFGRYLIGNWDHNTTRDVPCLAGAFMMVPARVIKSVGMLDEKFFMDYEDVDYCARLGENGFSCRYLSEASITHFTGQSRSKSSRALSYDSPSALYTYFLEHGGSEKATIARVLLLVQALVRIPLALFLAVFSKSKRFKRTPKTLLDIGFHFSQLKWCIGALNLRERSSG
jgi:GT2 family glycosyltransferase